MGAASAISQEPCWSWSAAGHVIGRSKKKRSIDSHSVTAHSMAAMGRRASTWALFFASAVAGLCGCGGSSSKAKAGCDGGCWHPTSADQDFVEQLCSLAADCCLRMRLPSEPGYTAIEHKSACSSTLLRYGISRDPGVRSACLEEVSHATGTTACMPELWQVSPGSACYRVIAEQDGVVAPGDHCQGAGDCAGSPGSLADCAPPTGRCYLMTPGKEGDECLASVSEFGVTYLSSVDFVGHFCSIAAGLVCYPSNLYSAEAHHCVRRYADGSSCVNDFECDSHDCSAEAGYVCTPTRQPHDLPVGATCSDDRDCESGHCSNSACQSVAQVAAHEALCAR